jgi:uncharacterized membrane protein YidH (DUF202 family)
MEADVGASGERTALAWQRTALGLVAGAAIMARLSAGDVGGVAVLCLAAAMLLSAWVFVESVARYRHRSGPDPRPRGGRAPLFLALTTVLIAAVEVMALARSW